MANCRCPECDGIGFIRTADRGTVGCERCVSRGWITGPIDLMIPSERRHVLDKTILQIRTMVDSAEVNWAAYNSAHEAWGVLAEEVKELFDEVCLNQKRRSVETMQKEAMDVAAVAIRFASLCTEDWVRK